MSNKSLPIIFLLCREKELMAFCPHSKFEDLSLLYFPFCKVMQARSPGTTCVPFATLANVLYTLTALSPTVSLFHKPGSCINRSWYVGSLWAFIAVLIFVYRGGSSFMVAVIIDSLDFPQVFQKSSYLITYYDCKLLSQVKR